VKLPIRRKGNGSDGEFERLRSPFAHQIENWPDFLQPVHSIIDAAVPPVDLEETDDSYLLEVDLPGISRRDMDLRVDDSRLVLTAQRGERSRVGLLRHRARTTGRLALVVSLPGDVDSDAVTADLHHGVLTVVVPKTPRARRRRILVTQRP